MTGVDHAASRRPGSVALGWFVAAVLVGVAFATYSDHRWEDFYITFRSSRNLVEGHGLVFQPGEPVHTFTSPLGVLLPALALKMSATGSDATTLWIFRAMCLAAFGGAAALLWIIGQAAGWSRFASGLAPTLLIVDAKSVDFTVNGMETAFMLLGLAAAIHAHVAENAARWWRLGGAWGLLMWTRPDGFVFAGAFSAAWFWFGPTARLPGGRRKLLQLYAGAAALAALLYLPWILWASHYYGSPIPNTIVAKGLAVHRPGLGDVPRLLLEQTFLFPWRGAVRDAFLPAYVWFGSWPPAVLVYFIGITWLCLFCWTLPMAGGVARVFSVAFFLCTLYAKVAPMSPWYVPSHAVFALLTLAATADVLLRRFPSAGAIRSLFCIHAAACVGVTLAVAWQMRVRQEIVETQRTAIGRWLHEHATSSRDTVFLEPLGYVGYFSQLKMLDFPGLAAPEVVDTRRVKGDAWTQLIAALRPDWLMLRAYEAAGLKRAAPELFDRDYHLAKRFDVAPQIAAISFLPGRAYLRVDETFEIYHRASQRPPAP